VQFRKPLRPPPRREFLANQRLLRLIARGVFFAGRTRHATIVTYEA
jgi:hypothetical protein